MRGTGNTRGPDLKLWRRYSIKLHRACIKNSAFQPHGCGGQADSNCAIGLSRNLCILIFCQEIGDRETVCWNLAYEIKEERGKPSQ